MRIPLSDRNIPVCQEWWITRLYVQGWDSSAQRRAGIHRP